MQTGIETETMVRFRRLSTVDALDAGVALWNVVHPAFAIGRTAARLAVFAPPSDVGTEMWGVDRHGKLVGFALLKRTIPGDQGWISLLVIDPDIPGHESVAANQVARLCDSAASHGLTELHVGKDVNHFLPGLPVALADVYGPVYERKGFVRGSRAFDVRRALTGPLPASIHADVDARPVGPEQTDLLLSFLADQFPGRWFDGAVRARRRPGGVRSYWGLWSDDTLVAFAGTSRVDAYPPPAHLSCLTDRTQRACGLGPLGVHEDKRGKRHGLTLTRAIMGSFREAGYTDVIIDWTTMVDYYAKLGFSPVAAYDSLSKPIEPAA